MEDKLDKTMRCEVTRIGVSLPGIPSPTEEFLRRKLRGLRLRDVQTRMVQTPLVSVQEAAKETIRLLKEYKAKIDQDVRVVWELLRLNPLFLGLQWVADAVKRLDRSPRAKRLRGRPKWRYTLYPEVVLGLVRKLRASGEAKSDRDAAGWLEISGVLSSTRVRRLLKQAKKDPRLKPMLSPPDAAWPSFTEDQLQEMYETAITPEPGQTLRFKLEGNRFKYVGVPNSSDTSFNDENNS